MMFDQIPQRQRSECEVCGASSPPALIRLPDFPLTEIFVDSAPTKRVGFVDQTFHLCSCGHGQLGNVVSPSFLYGRCYHTRTAPSESACAAVEVFLSFVKSVLKDRPIESVVEIGCNDLYTLGKFKGRARRLIGIDPIFKDTSCGSLDDDTMVIGEFAESVDFSQLGVELDVVISSHTLEHLESPRTVVDKLLREASAETLFFFQFPSLEALVEDFRFDQIFHQHLNYFSLQSVSCLLESLGAELIDHKFNMEHWGALMVAFRKSRSMRGAKPGISKAAINSELMLERYGIFRDAMSAVSRRIAATEGKQLAGYGAALMLPVLSYYVSSLASLRFVIDEDPLKDGLYYLNFPLPIVNPKKAGELREWTVVVTAVSSKQSLRAITSKLIAQGVRNIIVPSISL